MRKKWEFLILTILDNPLTFFGAICCICLVIVMSAIGLDVWKKSQEIDSDVRNLQSVGQILDVEMISWNARRLKIITEKEIVFVSDWGSLPLTYKRTEAFIGDMYLHGKYKGKCILWEGSGKCWKLAGI